MPFKILSEDGELLVEEQKDLEFRQKQKTWSKERKIRETKRRCWHRNKEDYNAKRRARDATIHGQFLAARRKARSVGQEWELTEEEWQTLWMEAGFMTIPGTITPSRPRGIVRTAFAMRGPNKYFNTYMTRHSAREPWKKTNCYIGFRGQPVAESPYYHSNK